MINKSLIRNKIKGIVPSKLSYRIKNYENMKCPERPAIEACNLYNEYGEKMELFYFNDVAMPVAYSITAGRIPRYIFWDRFHYNLPIHFYSDDMIFSQKWKPLKKYALLLEPESLQPQKYKTILKHPEWFEDYDCIFTHSTKILNSMKNAKPLIVGGVYIGTEFGGGVFNEKQYEKKTKNISIVSSDKCLCELHTLRYQLATKYKNGNKVDCFGTFDNGGFIKAWDALGEYRYSFAIENYIDDYWITEKICNCFASMTVPIYIGSEAIGEFFNLDGIIRVDMKEIDKIDEIIKQCSVKDYEERIPAIIDNFYRVKKYLCLEDWLFENYKDIILK